jgi:hypothetical protein
MKEEMMECLLAKMNVEIITEARVDENLKKMKGREGE